MQENIRKKEGKENNLNTSSKLALISSISIPFKFEFHVAKQSI
jgi:hypothetical protein